MTLQMLGSHSLVDLRDAICCISDLQVFGEFSNTPDMAPDFISKVTRTQRDTQAQTILL
jgi:snRNA-activating protein complex subunit 3